MITCRGGLLVQPHHTIADHPPLDVIVIPGGQGTRRERLNATVLDWIVAQDQRTEVTTSVCTGAFLLAERGLLDGLRATTHWASIAWMREHYPSVRIVDDERFVDEGHIVTSAGVSAGIDMALHVVARLAGEATAAATARSMEYDRTFAALSPGWAAGPISHAPDRGLRQRQVSWHRPGTRPPRPAREVRLPIAPRRLSTFRAWPAKLKAISAFSLEA